MTSLPVSSTWNGTSRPLPRVLVLLACRNGAEFIERQVASVLAQTDVEVRLEVRDDGSQDGTADIVERLSANEPRVQIRADRNPSGSAAGNFFLLIQAAQIAGFDHVALCDQDDEWYPDKLIRAVKMLRVSNCNGYSSSVRAVWPDGRSRVLGQRRSITQADYLFEGAGQGCTFVLNASWFAELQRELAHAGSLLSKVHYHDWMIYALTRASGKGWLFDPAPTMAYRQHESNDTGARNSLAGVARRLKAIRAGWYRDQVGAVAAVVLLNHPDNKLVSYWDALSQRVHSQNERFQFIARHGRRRRSDRLIQLAAVLLRYL